ncbi:MAG TPA: divergent polysaccharide deacetylase family protein [Deltaproteobacteria bacterium]|nr:divergent polysaccharide deacetylase family protein [Deltaproteobacteria bacterium]
MPKKKELKRSLKSSKFRRFLNILLILCIGASVAAIAYVLTVQEEKPVAVETHKAEPAREKIVKIMPGFEKEVVPPTDKITPPRKRIAIVIDDIGYDLRPVRNLMEIDADITFAVLPFLAYSRQSAEMLNKKNCEILLHLPMEPVSYPAEKPGEGALFTDMNDMEILHQLGKNIEAVPYIAGVNNHMGSKFMQDRGKLAVVFAQLKSQDLFFIDSRTVPDSEAVAVAREIGLSIAERKMFIDNKRDYDEIYKNLMSVALNPEDNSPVILIGHPYPETIRAIRDAAGQLRKEGIVIVPVSQIVKSKTRP